MLTYACLATAAPALAVAPGPGPVPCDLKLKFGARSEGPPQQFHVNLEVVNVDNSICRVSGYPDVELIGPDYPIWGTIYSLPQSTTLPAESVSLRLGQSIHAVITWLPSSFPRGRYRWVPGYVRVVVRTNRGLSFAMALPWVYGSVERQDGATHPGTYVGPIRRGAA
jgi:Protein of unknown function (DUF4232)